MDDMLSPALQNYILNTTTREPSLVAQLRKETQTLALNANMLCGPVEGQFLHMLVKLSAAKTCLELGTFTGYSALYIASALPADGQLITCESQQTHANVAQKYFNRSPDGHKIALQIGEAALTLSRIHSVFDFAFIDADKINYPLYYDMVLPKLRSGGLMVVDNALREGQVVSPQDKRTLAIHTLNIKASQDEKVETVMLSVRDGILLIRKK